MKTMAAMAFESVAKFCPLPFVLVLVVPAQYVRLSL